MALFYGAGNWRRGLHLSSKLERLENLRSAFRREIFVKIIVHLHCRRTRAGPNAFYFLERENAVRGGLLVADFELLLNELIQLIPAAQHAGNVCADLHVIFSRALTAQHRVIPHRLGDLQRIQVKAARDRCNHVLGDVTELVLRVKQHGNQRRTPEGIPVFERLKLRFQLRREIHQRSISPSTISSVPMDAMTSAISRPSTIFFKAWRFTNDGARILMRYGFGEPSLAIKHPSSPRGDSMR